MATDVCEADSSLLATTRGCGTFRERSAQKFCLRGNSVMVNTKDVIIHTMIITTIIATGIEVSKRSSRTTALWCDPSGSDESYVSSSDSTVTRGP